MSPADLATIYNINPLFAQGYNGQGQTIAFSSPPTSSAPRTGAPSAPPSGSRAMARDRSPRCTRRRRADPTTAAIPAWSPGEDGEAALDAEWASAAAPSAAIELGPPAPTPGPPTGLLIALQNLINATQPAPIMSVSFGECEPATAPRQRHDRRRVSAGGRRRGIGLRGRGRRRRRRLRRQRHRGDPRHSGERDRFHALQRGGRAHRLQRHLSSTVKHLLEHRQQPPVRARRCPTFPRYRGTIPARARSTRLQPGCSPPYGSSGLVRFHRGHRRATSTTAAGAVAPAAARPGSARRDGVVGGNCAGIPETLLADGRGRHRRRRRRARSSRRIPLRGRRRPGALLRLLLVEHRQLRPTSRGRGAVHRLARAWAGGGGTSFCVAHHGRNPGPDQPEGGFGAGQSQPGLLPARGAAVRQRRRLVVQLELGRRDRRACASSTTSPCGDNDVNCTGSRDCYAPVGAKSACCPPPARPTRPAFAEHRGLGLRHRAGERQRRQPGQRLAGRRPPLGGQRCAWSSTTTPTTTCTSSPPARPRRR